MCLITKNKSPLIAEDDIVCYKLLVKTGNDYRTPYKLMYLDNKIVYGKKNLVAEGSEDIEHLPLHGSCIPDRYKITGGFIHCYTDHETAIYRADFFDNNECVVYVTVFECIIPKGTAYYKGNNCDICAKEIKLIKKVYTTTAF